MPLSAGDKLGPYEILAPIGAGGMGEVYKARDTRLNRIVALKVSKSEFTKRFEQEARAISALNHNHICQLYDVGPNYLVMEYIEGAPLRGPLPLEKALECAGQIASALDAAHTKKITPSRSETREHFSHKAGREAARFWTGEDRKAPRCGSGNHDHGPHYEGPDPRYAAVHVA